MVWWRIYLSTMEGVAVWRGMWKRSGKYGEVTTRQNKKNTRMNPEHHKNTTTVNPEQHENSTRTIQLQHRNNYVRNNTRAIQELYKEIQE